jgi:hypothetical protein
MVVTLIKSTAATRISGTFNKLPNGDLLTINGSNFQASDKVANCNHLTLTVVM